MIRNEIIRNMISEINIVSENKNELYNILIPLILSNKFFKNSNEKREFIENVLGFQIANYAYKSSPILVGKVIKNINALDVEDAFSINNKVNNFILDVLKINEIVKNKEPQKENIKKHKKSSFFNNWNTYINDLKKQK